MSSPLKAIRPAAIRCAPAIARRRVVLPAPLAPTSATVSPFSMLRLTPCTALAGRSLQPSMEEASHHASRQVASITRISHHALRRPSAMMRPRPCTWGAPRPWQDMRCARSDDRDAAGFQFRMMSAARSPLRPSIPADFVRRHGGICGERAGEFEPLSIDESSVSARRLATAVMPVSANDSIAHRRVPARAPAARQR